MSTKRITLEYKDDAGEFRLTQKALNGNITHASTEGYKNRKDLRNNQIDSAIAVLKFYKRDVGVLQCAELHIAVTEIYKVLDDSLEE